MIITGEAFVAAVSRQRDRHVLARDAADEVRRDHGAVGEGLIEVADELLEGDPYVGAKDLDVMIRPEVLGHLVGPGDLIEHLIGKPDREGPDPMRRGARHQCHDKARVDTARKKRADRHVAGEMQIGRSDDANPRC